MPYTFSGSISGTGAFEQIGTGQTTLTGANTYSGTTTISSGILRAGSLNVFSPSSPVVIGAGAALDLNGFSNTIGSLSGNGSVINSALFTVVTLTLGNSNTAVFSGIIGQAGSVSGIALTKAGLGTEILTGTNLAIRALIYGQVGLAISYMSIRISTPGVIGSRPVGLT